MQGSTVQDNIVPDGTAVQTDAVNAFGGSGTLYPVGWTNHGNMTLIRDNDNYYRYYFSGDALCLLRGPLTGGQFTTIGALEGLSENLFYYVIFDGERIYTGNLDIISDGSAENSFDPSAVQEYLQTLNADAEPQDLRYECINIWHIRDRYFIVMQDVSKALEDSYTLTADNYEVWTDDSGSILSAERVGNSISYIIPHKCEKAQLSPDFFDRLSGSLM